MRGVGVDRVQLALDPIRLKKWDLNHTRQALQAAGISIASAMWMPEGEDYSTLESIRATGGVAPERTWAANVKAAKANAKIARELGMELVTFHAGAVPDGKRGGLRAAFVDRVHRISRIFAEQGVRVALETGQETWSTMLDLLGELDRLDKAVCSDSRVGVNFDPANMILYGTGDPIEAMTHLLPRIVQAHVKDAKATSKPGTWGTEVIAGDGDVLWSAFFELADVASPPIEIMIEREGGKARVEDARTARTLIDRRWAACQVSASHTAQPLAPQPRAITIGVLGLGFMGRTHIAAYQALAQRRATAGMPAPRVIAVCDEHADARAGLGTKKGNIETKADLWDASCVATYSTAKDLFADPSIDAVSICTPTHTHKKLVWEALAAGKHVLVEKPAVLDPKDARELADAAVGAARIVMPAMCMRFWPGWPWLKEAIDSKRFGKLTSLVFQRLGTRPAWSGVYNDDRKTGGAIGDLHVHDADLVLWMLGAPDAVATVGGTSHVSTQYYYDRKPGLIVTAEASWEHAPGWSFAMRYCATFEHATASFDLSRERPLMVYREGRAETVELAPGTGYDLEVEHFTDLVVAALDQSKVIPIVTMRDAERAAALLQIERASQVARRIAEFEDVLVKKVKKKVKPRKRAGKKRATTPGKRAKAEKKRPKRR
jgi:L-ribulose-5-phosphate 3-epimerase